MIALYLIGMKIGVSALYKSYSFEGFFNIVTSELIVSSPDEISRERLEREATLLDSVERETECEAVTEREDTYEVIIESDGERTYHEYVTSQTWL